MNITKKGFTLIELLVVIAIISLLSTVVLGQLNGARSRARDAARVSNLNEIEKALTLYRHDFGSYPTPPEGGGVNFTNIGLARFCVGGQSCWNGSFASALAPYIKSLPQDPLYTNPGSPTFGVYNYIYKVLDNGNSYDLVVRLENESSSTCPNRQWPLNAGYAAAGGGTGASGYGGISSQDSWCDIGGSGGLIADH